MKLPMPALLCSLCLALPVTAATSFPQPLPAPLDSQMVAAMLAKADPQLELLRAGHTVAPQAFDANQRGELRAADASATELLDLRAGFLAPTDNEWTWLAIGAGIVLLIVLL